MKSLGRIPVRLRIAFIIVMAGGTFYWSYQLGETVYGKYTALVQHDKVMTRTVSDLTESLTTLTNEYRITIDALHTAQNTIASYEEQIGKLTGTVGTYEKLSRLDPELLKKYSKVYFLNEHYVPSSLSTIDPIYISGKGRVLQIHTRVWPRLRSLLENAQSNNIDILITSAYRSFEQQKALKSGYRVVYGAGTANQFSAEQGYSEHQLGTTIDFTTKKSGGVLQGFDKTPAFTWLTQHAYEYGFVLSYPKNNKYYTYEPWHWRYVGLDLARKLHEEGTYLYNLDQRDIDGYLVSIFD